jgi:hypothetical protein
MSSPREEALHWAVRSGALVRYEVELERGEHYGRRLWLRPNVISTLSAANLGDDQLVRVRAALRRFVVGGQFNVVSKTCTNPGSVGLADIRELKTDPPPFMEIRFKPPKYHLRVFGRFICEDGLILTSAAMKSPQDVAGGKRLSVTAELKRCVDFFRSQRLDTRWIPPSTEVSITNAKII